MGRSALNAPADGEAGRGRVKARPPCGGRFARALTARPARGIQEPAAVTSAAAAC